MDVDLVQLRAFREVAERGTVAAAAAALGYTAPAVSQQIGKLEARLGTSLFDRVGGRLRLSDAGRAALSVAASMLDLSDDLLDIGVGTARRRVVVAAFASALRSLVLPAMVLPGLRERFDLEVREVEDDDALRELRLGTVDVAIIQEYDLAPRSPPLASMVHAPLMSDRLRLIAPPGHHVDMRLSDLAHLGWLANGSGTRCERATEQVLARAGIEPRVVGRVSDNETLLALVAAGQGVTIVPELVLAGTSAAVTIGTVDLNASRTIIAVTRQGSADALRPLLAVIAQQTHVTPESSTGTRFR